MKVLKRNRTRKKIKGEKKGVRIRIQQTITNSQNKFQTQNKYKGSWTLTNKIA